MILQKWLFSIIKIISISKLMSNEKLFFCEIVKKNKLKGIYKIMKMLNCKKNENKT